MTRRTLGFLAGWGLALAVPMSRARAQVTLADDIIVAAQAKANEQKAKRSALGISPGSTASPYRKSPGSTELLLGVDSQRKTAPLPQLTRRPGDPTERQAPGRASAGAEQGLAPTVLRLDRTAPLGPADSPTATPRTSPDVRSDLGDDPGPPGGLTLDEAINRLVTSNRELRTKFLELPQAEADVLSAGLLENPLLFYSSDSVPYGKTYSASRPGDISHGISLVYPLDLTGKRRARVAVARQERLVLGAQYQDAVRLAIDNLATAYVDALAARQAVRSAERGLESIQRLLNDTQAENDRTAEGRDAVDDLIIERDLAALSLGDARERFHKTRERLAILLDLPPAEVETLELTGSLRILEPDAPPVETLIALALCRRPDLLANKLGVGRAARQLDQEKAERFSDPYFLYTPYEFRDNSYQGQRSVTGWGAGLFVSVPLFNRNQGNLKRAEINIAQARNEATAVEREVIAEVEQAVRDFRNTREDALRLESQTIPAVRRKRDRAAQRLQADEISVSDYFAVLRDTTTLVRYYRDTLTRHRRNTLKINTAVGCRVMP